MAGLVPSVFDLDTCKLLKSYLGPTGVDRTIVWDSLKKSPIHPQPNLNKLRWLKRWILADFAAVMHEKKFPQYFPIHFIVFDNSNSNFLYRGSLCSLDCWHNYICFHLKTKSKKYGGKVALPHCPAPAEPTKAGWKVQKSSSPSETAGGKVALPHCPAPAETKNAGEGARLPPACQPLWPAACQAWWSPQGPLVPASQSVNSQRLLSNALRFTTFLIFPQLQPVGMFH